MVTGKTKSGYEYTVDERVFTDWRYVQLLRDAIKSEDDTKKVFAIIDLGNFVLGEDGLGKLTDKIAAQNDGYAPIDKVMEELLSIEAKKEETVKN